MNGYTAGDSKGSAVTIQGLDEQIDGFDVVAEIRIKTGLDLMSDDRPTMTGTTLTEHQLRNIRDWAQGRLEELRAERWKKYEEQILAEDELLRDQ